MKLTALTICIILALQGFSQKNSNAGNKQLLNSMAERACKCADSISTYNRTKSEIAEDISKCIDKETTAYQLASKLLNIDTTSAPTDPNDGKKQVNITLDLNKNSEDYKKYYYEIERHLMQNCNSVITKLASNDKQNKKSLSSNSEALEWYYKGIDESKAGDYKKAIKYYEKALKIDPEFAFAWDNLGISYRKLENYDMAIEAYQKSLEIDPAGIMPLQNIAIVYQYKKEYLKAIEAYEKLAKLNDKNPEVFYGIGSIYALNLQDYEKGLNNLCIAYNLYIEQKSPYRTDAEKIINIIYSEMKKQGNETKFFEILKANNIKTE